MPNLAFALGAYKRSDLPELRVQNQYVEATPASAGDPVVLLPRPALEARYTVGSGPIRGVFSSPNVIAGDTFAVSSNTLFRGTTALGGIDGTNIVSMASTTDTLMVAGDVGLYTTDGATVTVIAFPDGAAVSSLGYLAGYAFATRNNSRRLYFTLDPTTWDGLDYVAAEQDTGDIVGHAIVQGQIWLFCERVTEVFTPTGNADAPFQRLEGRLYDKGCLARDTIARADNSVIWVGNDRIVYRGAEVPTRVSNNGIEERLQEAEAGDLRTWTFPWEGHTFAALRIGDATFVYDFSTGEWSEWASFGRGAWRAHVGIFKDGEVIAGDDTTGQIWAFSGEELTDDGALIVRSFTALLGKGPVLVDNIVIDCSSGQSPVYGEDAMIEARLSRDGGFTWQAWRTVSLGERGRYRSQPVWRRWGLIDNRSVFEFRLSDQTRWRLSSVAANESLAGRSR